MLDIKETTKFILTLDSKSGDKPVMINDPLKENRKLAPISNPSGSVLRSHTSSVCTIANSPIHCKEGVVQCGGNADSGVGKGGVDEVANHTPRAVDGRSP